MNENSKETLLFKIQTRFDDGTSGLSEHTISPSSDSDFMADVDESRWFGELFWSAIDNCCGDVGPHLVDFMIGCERSASGNGSLCKLLILFDEWEMEEARKDDGLSEFIEFAQKKMAAEGKSQRGSQ